MWIMRSGNSMQSAAENEGGKEKGGKRHRVESPWRFFFLVALVGLIGVAGIVGPFFLPLRRLLRLPLLLPLLLRFPLLLPLRLLLLPLHLLLRLPLLPLLLVLGILLFLTDPVEPARNGVGAIHLHRKLQFTYVPT